MKQMGKKLAVRLVFLFSISVLLVSIIGCGESGSAGDGSNGPGETASIALNPGMTSLPADDKSSTYITAVLKDSTGAAVERYTTVVFTTTLGTFQNGKQEYKAETLDDSGQISVPFLGGITAGLAEITVSSNNVRQTTKIQITSDDPGETVLGSLDLSSETDGIGRILVYATVKDTSGSAISGVQVKFITTLGTFLSTNGVAASDTTDDQGVAEVVLLSGNMTGMAEIQANIESAYGDATQDLEVLFSETSHAVNSISIVSGSNELIADGSDQTTIRAVVMDSEGSPISLKAVNFTATAGLLSQCCVETDANGTAEVMFTASTKTGNVTIRAQADGFIASTDIALIAGVPASIQVSASPGNLTADGASTSQVSIIVKDAQNNPVNGKSITLDADYGTLSQFTVTTSDGQAGVEYTAPNSVPAGNRAKITAETTNGIIGSVDITLIGPQIAGISLSADPMSIPADGNSQSLISATLTMAGGGNVPDGTMVNFSIVSGDGEITASSTTSGGIAIATLTSGTIPGTATIRAEAGGRVVEQEMTYTSGDVSLIIVPNSILGTGQQKSKVTVSVMDAAGNPVNGDIVRVQIDNLGLGNISPASETLSNGAAEFEFSGGASHGTVTVTATWDPDGTPDSGDEVSGSRSIDIQAPPAFIQVDDGYPDPKFINIVGTGGQATAQIVLNVKDNFGNPVADGYRVDFEILDGPDGGEAVEPTTVTTIDGQISTVLRSGRKSGPVSIKATYYYNTNVSTTISQIAINAGPPVGEEFGIFAEYLNVSGLWKANLEDLISVNVADVYGNAVPDDTAISFKTYNTGGFFSPNVASTLGGLASNTLHSSGTTAQPLNGFLSVTAEANNGGRTTHVTTIAVNPDDASILFAGTDGGGAYKSIDGGSSWSNITRTSDPANLGQNYIDPYINDISIDPDDSNIVYAATGYWGGGHIYRSLDGGLRWNSGNPEEWHGLLSIGSSALAIVCDDGNSKYVWAGTEGMGAVYAPDGETFQWGGAVVSGPTAVGTTPGALDVQWVGMTAQTETWTAQFTKSGASITRPVLYDNSGNSANGVLADVSATSTASDETWTITYIGGISDVDESGVTNPANVELSIISGPEDSVGEEWTVTCVDATSGDETFRVQGSQSGIQSELASINTNYTTSNTDNAVTFYIIGEGMFEEGDVFTFSTFASRWTVEGSVSGLQTRQARTGEAYTSDEDEVSFTIVSGSRLYGNGDVWTFDTNTFGNWFVAGSKSGVQIEPAETGMNYVSDNGEVSFFIAEDPGDSFETGDMFQFGVKASGLGFGKTVRDIEKASGNGISAVLYAATPTGVYKTINGGKFWEEVSSFPGDNIATVAVHPDSPDTIYAGTQEAGIWYSVDGGLNWTQFIAGLGEGLRSTVPVADSGNTGTGVMNNVTVGDTTKSENWRVVYDESNDHWVVAGTVSGQQVAAAFTGTTYVSDGNELEFLITEGSTAFADGDTFRFKTIRDPGMNIKDLQVYHDAASSAYHLYAITYFFGALEAHAAGNVYVTALDSASGYAPTGEWEEANTNLPAFDPPSDATLFAQHVLAVDVPNASRELFIGGEGINFYKAANETLSSGVPVWEESKSGLSNRIMARMPILFSGVCSMDVTPDDNGNDGDVTYTVYIQDANGNPPIEGSTFKAIKKVGEEEIVLLSVDYPDTYSYQGTWSDPSDPSTNNPYIIRTPVGPYEKVIFTFTPTCVDQAPGCSGSEQELTYSY